jgi:hypothetical protein
MDPRVMLDSLVKLLRQKWPWVDMPKGPILARVVKVYGDTGAIEELRQRYCIDVQVLLQDGSDDTSWPVIPEVPLPIIWGGSNTGIFCAPAVGAVVRVGFEYGDINRPYVESISGLRGSAPSRPDGGLLIRQGDNEIRIAGDGSITIKGPKVSVGPGAMHAAVLGDKIKDAVNAFIDAAPSASLQPNTAWAAANVPVLKALVAAAVSGTVEVSE